MKRKLAALLLMTVCHAVWAGQVTELRAVHRGGQTLLTWREVDPPTTQETISAKELRKLRGDLAKMRKVRYRVYRATEPIRSLAGLEALADVPPLTCWNADYHGIYPKPEHQARRYAVEDGAAPVPPGTGIYAPNPKEAGDAWYAVTVVLDGTEERTVGAGNVTAHPISETVGPGVPVLQRTEKPDTFMYVKGPTLHYYVRWEAPPNCATASRPYDYLVAIPANLAKPAPVGIHLHCWGGSLNGGYGWWYNAEKGDILIASNQIPYDWWTGYHEAYFDGRPSEAEWKKGVVRPYSTTRMLSFLDWVATKWDVDLTRTHVAGNSMGGSGSPMFAIRHSDRIAWAIGWVGVHVPAKSPQFKGSYERVYGKPEWNIKFEDGTPVWDYYSDPWYLRKYPKKEIGFITFSNGKNDGGIGWPQAAEFFRALQETRRPHVFVWGQSGHGQRALMPVSLGQRVLPIDVRTDQSLPAFTHCSLDDAVGNGDPKDGDDKGQANLYLAWETKDIVDTESRWETTVYLIAKATQDTCTVHITPRRLQKLNPEPGRTLPWTNTDLKTGEAVQKGAATADRWGLVTLEKVTVGKGKNRIVIGK
jgi:pimeloyl-ACP methyl ester carboxylesterase